MRVPDVIYLSDEEEVVFLEYMKSIDGAIIIDIPEDYDNLISEVPVVRIQIDYDNCYSEGVYESRRRLYLLEVLDGNRYDY